ncbi:MAG: ABC transporter substrate-binding protein [Anaerolineae bacterium]
MAHIGKLSRRGFLHIAGAAGGAAVLAACVATPAPQVVKETVVVEETVVVKETVEVVKAPAGQPVIRFTTDWYGGVRGELTNQFLAKWKDEVHPDITIAYEPCPRVQDRLRVEFAAGTPPDVMLFAPELFAAFADQLLVLDPFWETADPAWKESVLGIDPSYYWDAHLVGVPFQHSIWGFAINTDLFEKAGVPMPWEYDHDGDKWWDWNDFLASAKAIQGIEEGIYGADVGGNTYMHWGPWIRTNGGEYVRPPWPKPGEAVKSALSEPEAAEALTFLYNVQCKENAAIPRDVLVSLAESLQISPFYAGKVGIIQSAGEVSMRRAHEESGFNGHRVATPRSPRTKYGKHHQGNCPHVASAKTAYPEACWELMYFLDGEWCQGENGLQGGAMPGLKSLLYNSEYMDKFMAGFPEIAREALQQCAEENDCLPGCFPNFEEWRDEVEAIAQDMSLCKIPVEQAIVEMDTVANSILSRPA